jgi:simple sugar transport system ATP-binding protein
VYFNCDRILHMRDGRLIDQYLPGPVPIDRIESDVHA